MRILTAKNIKKAAVFLLALAAAVAAVCYYRYKTTDTDDEIYSEQLKLFAQLSPDSESSVGSGDLLAQGRSVNEDIVGWITIPDTGIDFPVVQCEDNQYYLEHDFEGNQSYMGVPFLDYRNSSNFTDFNSIIYGHNIKNKQMFSPINNFKENDYFQSHSFGYLTLTDKRYKLNLIASMVIESDGFVYDTVFLSSKERIAFLENVKENAVCIRDFSTQELKDKRLCTLSTCSYEFDDARTVLIGYLSE